MKNYYLNPPQQPDTGSLDSLFAEMILEKAILNFQKEKILTAIDEALSNNNKEDFLRFTNELKKYDE
jgi:uncharacterized protein YpiB (UPF0302 family)